MDRICPLDAAPIDNAGGWEAHIKWHLTELSAEVDALTDIHLSALDIDAFLDHGRIRPWVIPGN